MTTDQHTQDSTEEYLSEMNINTVLRALVVDDEPDINQLVALRLRKRKFQVTSVGNAEAALPMVEADPPDLIFLDVSMPGMSGVEMLQVMRAHGIDIAVVMMTAFGSEQVAIEALRSGADDYLRKPFEPTEFDFVLERTVSRLLLRRENASLQAQLEAKHRQLEAELARAATVQANLLPRTLPSLLGFELAGICVPAREVGGDFYDWLEGSPGTLTFALGDVMGKGMPAALWMATARAAMRAAGKDSPAASLQSMVQSLAEDLEYAGQFITLFLAQLDIASRQVTYVDAGHGLTLLRRADGTVQHTLDPRGLPLGVLRNERYHEGKLILQPNDILIVYSDGLLDACPGGERDCVRWISDLEETSSAQRILEQLVRSASCYMPLPDDLTILVLRCSQKEEISDALSK